MIELAKVIFIPGDGIQFEKGVGMDNVVSAMKEFGFKWFSGENVLVKLHMG